MILVGHHSNIIQLIGSCLHKGHLHIIMELAEGGDLLTYLRQGKVRHEQYVSVGPDGSLTEQQTRVVTDHCDLMLFAWHIAKGMSYLESVKCIHRDLAARNCLLTAGPVAKLSDFGLSRDVYENGYYFRRFKGRVPYKWLSPEALLWGQYSGKSDVWSYGILLWEVATFGGTPYAGVPPDKIADMHRARYRLHQPPACPDPLYRVMRACWHEDPRKRPRFRHLCDVMETFVQAATENKYLDLQGRTYPILPDMMQEMEQPHHSLAYSSSYANDVTLRRGTTSSCSAPYNNQSPCPHRHQEPVAHTAESLPHCRLPLKTPHSSLGLSLHALTWGSWDQGKGSAGDSGGDMERSEVAMELQPMLNSASSEWEQGVSGSGGSFHPSQWDDDSDEFRDVNRDNYWTSGYSSCASFNASRVDTGHS